MEGPTEEDGVERLAHGERFWGRVSESKSLVRSFGIFERDDE